MKPIFTFPQPRRRLAEQSFHLKDRKTCPNKRSHRKGRARLATNDQITDDPERRRADLSEDYTADTGEKATNAVRYRLKDGGKTLVEDEREVTSEGNEHNVWVLERKATP